MTRFPRRKVAIAALALLAALAAGYWRFGGERPGTDPLVRARPAVEEGLGEWFQWWRTFTPGLDLKLFRKTRSGPLNRVQDYYERSYDPSKPPPFKGWTAEDEALRRPLYIYSPDRTKFIDPDIYLDLAKEDSQIEAGWDVDSAVALGDLSRRVWITLLFCGTPCGFDDALWINNDTVAIAGWSETGFPKCGDQYNPCPIAPILWLYELSTGLMTEYEGPAVPEETLAGLKGRESYVWRRLKGKLPNLKGWD